MKEKTVIAIAATVVIMAGLTACGESKEEKVAKILAQPYTEKIPLTESGKGKLLFDVKPDQEKKK